MDSKDTILTKLQATGVADIPFGTNLTELIEFCSTLGLETHEFWVHGVDVFGTIRLNIRKVEVQRVGGESRDSSALLPPIPRPRVNRDGDGDGNG